MIIIVMVGTTAALTVFNIIIRDLFLLFFILKVLKILST